MPPKPKKRTAPPTESTSAKPERYAPRSIEPRWQKVWAEAEAFATPAPSKGARKMYVLDMFPYPSGEGLHIGHVESYTASDIVARYHRRLGKSVLHPMGWDAFGLPAENYAIKTGVHPAKTTAKNISNFRRQLQLMGFSYDWSREVNTTDPGYYTWTQWIFLQLFKAGLAYEAEVAINWCPSCKTGLANEEVVAGECDRCGTQVGKKTLRQWLLRITKYAEPLLHELDELDWPERIKTMQRNWIGRSEGSEVSFAVAVAGVAERSITVFTTRADTLFGCTYLVLAPEHPLAAQLATTTQRAEVQRYIDAATAKSDVERTAAKQKAGVFTGSYAINPANGQNVPIWVADYVLASYGTGAIMAVPAHDERDNAFAQAHDLPIKVVVEPDAAGTPEPRALDAMSASGVFTGEGRLVNSGEYDGLDSSSARAKITAALSKRTLGRAAVHYKLRDWVFSRQRYWGEPIPIGHCPEHGAVPVPEDQLPVRLPEVEKFEPTGTGESPLAGIEEWVSTTCPRCKQPARRETNTMPQWAGSSWYFCGSLIPATTRPPGHPRRSRPGCPSTSTSGALSTPCCTCSTRASGSRRSTTPSSCRSASRS
ncbi:MAG: leucine--tRNA ligase [Candidatus Andersenbacteria bacterium]